MNKVTLTSVALTCLALIGVAWGCASGGAPAAREDGGESNSPSQDAASRNDAGLGAAWRFNLPPVDVECDDTDATSLYDKRIAPLFDEDRPSSCNECHLSGLDLEVFMRDDPCETMACMQSSGLVDLEDPDESLVLSWIARANPQSDLITEQVLSEEYQGFREWIHYTSVCDECVGTACPGISDGGEPFCETEAEPRESYGESGDDPGGCSEAELVQVFKETVYAARGRCSPCHHNNHDFDAFKAPLWCDVNGDCETAARRTYWNVLDQGYVDVDEPAKSLLLLKPLATDLGGVEHGGHDKFYSVTDDPGYTNFLYFIERYAGCQ